MVAKMRPTSPRGTMPPVAELVGRAHETGALVALDGVHLAQHRALDLHGLDADIIACSPYKFFGPHLGMLAVRRGLLEGWTPYKVRPADDGAPSRWETGTQNHEALAGLIAAVGYFTEVGAAYGGAPAGASARAAKPVIEQLFIADGKRSAGEGDEAARARFERALFIIRKQVEHAGDRLALANGSAFYIVSLSANTLIYKGMLTADQIAPTFPDLVDPDMESALALVHQRFSTNTFPSWPLAHPYRYVAHNGEINTLRGNINWMHAREAMFESELFGDDIKKILPIINPNGSDSSMFDNTLELLVLAGRPLLDRQPSPGRIDPVERVRDVLAFHSRNAS
jgi:hypothetical protein